MIPLRPSIFCAAFVAAAALCLSAAVPVHTCIDDFSSDDEVAGIWQFRPSGAVVELRRAPGNIGAYDMFLLDSPELAEPMPAKIASMIPAGEKGVFDAEIVRGAKDAVSAPGAMNSRSFIISVADGNMRLRPYRRSPRLSPERWFRYFLHTTLTGYQARPDGTIGAVRLSPVAAPASGRNIASIALPDDDSVSDTALDAAPADSATRARIALLGYDKPRYANAETMFVRSALDDDIAGLHLTITYRTESGDMLHRRKVRIIQDIPAGQTRMCRWKSWDSQKSFYYIHSAAPRFGGATAFSVTARIDSIYYSR